MAVLLSELYIRDNTALFQYLRDEPITLDSPQAFLNWQGSDQVLEDMGIDFEKIDEEKQRLEDAADQGDYEAFYQIEAFLNSPKGERSKQEFASYLLDRYPQEAPTWAHASLTVKQLIPRTTWLIHFSDNAEKIWLDGFKRGMFDMTRLGLTTYFGDGAKEMGGFNFAYDTNGRDYRLGEAKYGKNAVMFQSSGVKVAHIGDEEEQVIFWGPSIPVNSIVYLRGPKDRYNESGRWQVVNGKSDHHIYESEDLRDVIAWVENNYQTHRKLLTYSGNYPKPRVPKKTVDAG